MPRDGLGRTHPTEGEGGGRQGWGRLPDDLPPPKAAWTPPTRTRPVETQTMYTDGKGNFWADPGPGLTEVEVDSHGQVVGTAGPAEPAPSFAKYVRGARDVTAMHHTPDGAALRDALDTHETMPLGTADTVTPDLRKALRERTGVSLDSLAQAIGLPYETVRGYEEGTTWEDPLGMGRAYGSYLDASYRDAVANGEVAQ